jgi:hypothetical protein
MAVLIGINPPDGVGAGLLLQRGWRVRPAIFHFICLCIPRGVPLQGFIRSAAAPATSAGDVLENQNQLIINQRWLYLTSNC